MKDDEQPSEIQSPVQRAFVVASLACFLSLIIFYWVARSAVNLIAVPWVETLVYALMPISVTFVILYRSCWHPEISTAARTVFLLLSCAILGGVVFASGILFYTALFCFNAFSGGNH